MSKINSHKWWIKGLSMILAIIMVVGIFPVVDGWDLSGFFPIVDASFNPNGDNLTLFQKDYVWQHYDFMTSSSYSDLKSNCRWAPFIAQGLDSPVRNVASFCADVLTIPINQHKIRLYICIHRRKIKFIFNEIDKLEFDNEVKYHLGGSYL